MRRSDSTDRNDRRGFALLEVLAVVALTAAFASIVLPFSGRLIERWWHGEATIENADAWMNLTVRLSADLAQAIALPASTSRGSPLVFQASSNRLIFIRPPRNARETELQLVAYVIERTSSSSSIVHYETGFSPSLVGLDPRAFGPATAAFTGAFDLAFVAVGADGNRITDWIDRKDMPLWIELTTRSLGRSDAPAASIVLPIAARSAVDASGAQANKP